MIKTFTDEELLRLARRIWFAPRRVAMSSRDSHGRLIEKTAFFSSVGILNGRSVEFHAPSFSGRIVGEYAVIVQYPHWDFPGMITIRKAKND